MAQTSDTHKTQTPPTLKKGSKGEAVKGLQNALRVRSHHVEIDGIFGPATEAAVRQFQRDAGLAEDGIVGPIPGVRSAFTWCSEGTRCQASQSSSSAQPTAGPRSST